MKKFNYISLALASLLFLGACEQELIELTDPEPNLTNVGPDPCGGAAGSANFTKFIAIGNSFVAGMQGGALFTSGQNNSLAKIVHTHLACAGGSATFNQPDINATLGWNLFVTQPFLSDPTKPILGRMLLQGTPPRPTPQAYAAGNLEALPNPAANPGFMYGGNKAALNNFAVPAIFLGQSLITQTGNWALAGVDPRFSPFYGRFASAPGTSTIIGDAAAAGGSFFMFWLGLDDFFLYAAFGGDATLAPLTPATGGLPNGFDGQYGAAVGSLLASNAELKGVIGNFPDILLMPHFRSVPWNAVVFTAADQATINGANAGYAGYNAALANPAFGLSEDEITKRTITFAEGANGFVIEDETLTDLTGFGVPSIRQTANGDIIPLSTGSILGTREDPTDPATTWGVGKALPDRYALIPSEIEAIVAARTGYNAVVDAVAAAYPTRLAVANVSGALSTLIANQAAVLNGITLTPNINPPTGIYSEDGAHFNTRGYAFIAKVFIESINAKFGSTVPVPNMSRYSATGLPIP
jgi:hypothetical protein